MIGNESKITMHGKECYITESLATAKSDIQKLTGRRTEDVPYIYSSPEIGYCITDTGRFFTVKMAKSLYKYVIVENKWHIKEREGHKKNPFVIAKADKGRRVELDIVKCVYCAFIAHKWINDKMYLKYKDGNNQNPVLANIECKAENPVGLTSFSAQSWKCNYQRFLTHIMCSVDIRHEDAEDCVQTAFVEAFISTCPYAKWLKSDNKEEERYKREVLWKQWSWQNAVMLSRKQRKAIDLDSHLQIADTLTEVQENSRWILDLVTPNQKRVLELYLDGYSECEIAKKMKYGTLASVQNIVRRAVANIQSKLTADKTNQKNI